MSHRVREWSSRTSKGARLELSMGGGSVEVLGRIKRVLVVEDDQTNAELMMALLELDHHVVQVAASGEAALELIQQALPDVVLMDVGLPGVDGYEVARRLRGEKDREHQVLLVALTGHALPEDRTRALEAGFDHHVVKPVDIAALRELVRG